MPTKLSTCLGLLCLMLGLGVASEASAQDCTARDADIFQSARRARTIVSDYNELHRIHRADLARNDAFARRTGQALPWRFDFAGVVSSRSTFGFEVCTNRGPREAKIGPLSAGGLFSIDVYEWGVGIEAFALLVDEVLQVAPTLEQTRTEDGGYRDPVGLANVQVAEVIYGGRLTLHEWASIVAGYIETGPLANYPGKDGLRLTTEDVHHDTNSRVYLGAGSPFGDTSLHLIFEPEDVASDIIELRADRVPLPIDVEMVGVVGAAYVEDESQVTADLGVADVLGFLTLVTATEFNPLRLRHVRGRVDWEGGPEMILRSKNPETGTSTKQEDAARLALDLGAFAEMSYFNSRHLEEQTGRDDVWGVAFGGTMRPDVTILMGQIDLWFGVNRPSELARVSDFVDHWQMGVRAHGRFGL